MLAGQATVARGAAMALQDDPDNQPGLRVSAASP